MKILSVVGARPQFVKLAPFSREIRKKHQEIIVHTGQHYNTNMSDSFFSDLDIPKPDIHLEVGSGLHGEQTGRMLAKLEDSFFKESPDLVVVFGDTNSTLAGSLAAAKLHIPIVHIEAGLRSFNRQMPEEINRIVTDHTANFLFAPTETAVNNLKREGLEKVTYLSGDIMVDSLNYALNKSAERKPLFESEDLTENRYYLLTLHRPQNVDNYPYLSALLNKLNSLSDPIIFPVHPRTMKILRENNTGSLADTYPRIRFIEPVGYLDFIKLQAESKGIITDSGGIQKEAYILRKPCITVRDETEWVETVETGWNILLNPYEKDFINKIVSHQPNAEAPDIFGTNVAEKMSAIISQIGNSLQPDKR